MRILFVDDQPQVLDSLRDALRPQRHAWRMAFAAGGAEALTELERGPCDVVVSDMRMSPMDGAELLGQVEQSHPDAVRIVLSGSAEREVVVRAAAVAHRFLAKPCDVDELVRVIDRSCALRALTSQGELQRVTTTATRLPAAPRLHNELTALLRDGEASPADAATIIEQDVAMSAKVLQLVNSAFFGLRRRVTDVREAAVMLGLSTLRALVLSAHAFDRLAPAEPIAGFDLDALQRHCSQVARVARELLPNGGDLEHVEALGLADRLDDWRAIAAQVVAAG